MHLKCVYCKLLNDATSGMHDCVLSHLNASPIRKEWWRGSWVGASRTHKDGIESFKCMRNPTKEKCIIPPCNNTHRSCIITLQYQLSLMMKHTSKLYFNTPVHLHHKQRLVEHLEGSIKRNQIQFQLYLLGYIKIN